MKCVVFSHKNCWRVQAADHGYATDGGFPKQMQALAGLFAELTVACPVSPTSARGTGMRLDAGNTRVVPLPPLPRAGLARRLCFPFWLAMALPRMFGLVLKADVVHCPIPGDVGTIGLLLAWGLRRLLFVRHCGNWNRQTTAAERFWRYFMRRYAGGRNVMLATGLADEPVMGDGGVRWVFSSSLWEDEIRHLARLRACPEGRALRVGIACRQVMSKGTGIVIEAAKELLKVWPELVVEVIGDGPDTRRLRRLAEDLGIANHVRFHGWVSQEDAVRRISEVDVFCLPSSSEGFPKVVLEALACGVPCITSRVSALARLSDFGGLVALNDPTPSCLAQSIRECVRPGIYEKMSACAVECAMRFSLEKWREAIRERLAEHWKDFGFGSKALA